MSLRGFHIFFISFVTFFFAVVAAYGFTLGASQDADFWQAVAWVASITAVIVPIYGVYFINKAKKLYS
ncbi:hypothetical protein [Rubritalea tangerina]|uniref:Uncharacterized protein n=1 Tax=Rubritalea tangerina TaxID=430798 RepID=A0ABW4ZDJ6_9BACT